MTLSRELTDYYRSLGDDLQANGPKRGDDIFSGTDYPREWAGFVGQEEAIEQLQVAVASAKTRGVRLDHTLIASGIAGVGKTTLATLLAGQMGVGFLQTSGPLDISQGQALLESCQDNDILFWDEIHRATEGNRNRADWILPYMTEGRLYLASGPQEVPDVTIVGATTDVGKLPLTLISRFMVQPTIQPYSPEEGAAIALNLAERMGVGVDRLSHEHAVGIATAADCNPRVMRQILTQIRDLGFAYPETHPNLAKAFRWAGVSPDGLSKISREILLLLLRATNHTLSLESLRAGLAEPGPLHHHEQQLGRRGLVEITGRGRTLTTAGIARARDEVRVIRG